MNERFCGLKLFNEKEKKEMLKEAIIILDTNILLDFYRASNKTSDELIKAFCNYSEQIWLPYYVGVEFYNRKYSVSRDVIRDNLAVKDQFVANYDKMIKSFSETFKEYKTEEDFKDIIDLINKNKKNIVDKVEQFIKNTNKKIESNIEKLDRRINVLIGDKITQKVDDDKFKELLIEGHNRMLQNSPPGYKDKGKDEIIGEYKVNGDYFIFEDMIRLAVSKQSDIVFITGDMKIDWYDDKDKRIRYELQKEFFCKTGKKLLMLNSSDFIDLHNKIKDVKVSPESKKEIKTLNNLNAIKDVLKSYSNIVEPIKLNYVDNLSKIMKDIKPAIYNEDLIKMNNMMKHLNEKIYFNNEIFKINNQLKELGSALNDYYSIGSAFNSLNVDDCNNEANKE